MDPRNEKIGILLVDQQTGFLGAATEFLEREDDLTVLGTAGGHAAALAQVRALGPKVILLDPSSPGMGGLGVIRIYKGLLPDVKVIVLTLMDSNTYRRASLVAGANDFVSKATLVTDLLPAIQRVNQIGGPAEDSAGQIRAAGIAGPS